MIAGIEQAIKPDTTEMHRGERSPLPPDEIFSLLLKDGDTKVDDLSEVLDDSKNSRWLNHKLQKGTIAWQYTLFPDDPDLGSAVIYQTIKSNTTKRQEVELDLTSPNAALWKLLNGGTVSVRRFSSLLDNPVVFQRLQADIYDGKIVSQYTLFPEDPDFGVAVVYQPKPFEWEYRPDPLGVRENDTEQSPEKP